MNWEAVGSVAAALIAIVALGLTLLDKRRQKHEALNSALQGEKEAVAFVAFQLEHQKWGRTTADRQELLSALIVAWIFESSDRARAMIHSALKTVYSKHAKVVLYTIGKIRNQLTDYVETLYAEEAERERRVVSTLKDSMIYVRR